MITIAAAGPCDHKGAISALLVEHWQEVAKNKELMVLAPNWDRYQTLYDAGMLFMLYAWEGEKLLGYSCNLIDQHLHYNGLRVASNDVLFVSKDARNSSTGLRLIAMTERVAKGSGATLMLWHAKAGSALDKLLKAKRLAVQDIIYSKPL